MSNDKSLRVTLIRSVIGHPPVQRKTVKALGLKKLNASRIHRDTPEIRGMINRVSHLVRVEEVDEA